MTPTPTITPSASAAPRSRCNGTRGRHPLSRASEPDLRYHPFYCEENIWHLCQEAELSDRPRAVVFISNPERTCAVWHQRASSRPGAPIVWDYHVVLLVGAPWEVWDPDTTLGLSLPASEYLRQSFRRGIPKEYLPMFRLVGAEAFVEAFASDRSHMKRPDGRFQKPPPPWPAIGAPLAPSNLMRFVDMEDRFIGEILGLAELLARVGEPG